jgi:DUF4097 and DUF4098 domain-containing protein YvlB
MRRFPVRWLRVAPAALLLAAAMLVAGDTHAGTRRAGEPFHWGGRIASGQTLTIHGINGWIHAEPATGSEAVVDAEKWGRRSDPDEVKIEVEHDRDGVRICARYPRAWGRGLTDCEGRGNTGHNDVSVDFTVRVPAGVEVRFFTVNGGIDAEGLASRVTAQTVNGTVRLETTGEAEASTVNGSITARATPRRDHLAFRTVNGSIRLEMPSGANAEVSAHTVNGAIYSDFPVTIRGGLVGRSLRGTLGRGGPSLELRTVNGSIRLLEM